ILLLDCHITHHQDDFIIKCYKNHIVPFEFPSHLTHVLQPLDVRVFHPWKHYHNKAINHALHSLEIEYTISSFFCNLGPIHEQTFQPHTIKNSFKDSGMFPVSNKVALKKMWYYNNKAKHTIGEPVSLRNSSEAASSQHKVSVEHDGDLELPTPSSSYFESQKGLAEWVDKAQTFSPSSKAWFKKWAEGTQVLLAQAQLQEETFLSIQT
ncbi:hypothetical protein L873DRAFT_1695567, partial [Choiromyces venosus 120613-1]